MKWSAETILSILDACAEDFTFPMLDNGYFYLAATRLSLFRSSDDWAIVIECFGFSPRSGIPNTDIYTFASQLYERKKKSDYISLAAYKKAFENNPHNEMRAIYPLDHSDWLNAFESEWLEPDLINTGIFTLRGSKLSFPALKDYASCGVNLLKHDFPQVFEFCRVLAAQFRYQILATEPEQRINILPEMTQILQLDEWHHPNLVMGELPSQSETFQQLAEVLETGEISRYQPTLSPNTHWSNWPNGGTL